MKAIRQFGENKCHLIISALVQEKISPAPEKVKNILDELKADSTMVIKIIL